LAAKYGIFCLIIGGAVGHMCANFLAVVAGHFIGKRCSEKCINYTGGAIFIGFALFSLIFDILMAK